MTFKDIRGVHIESTVHIGYKYLIPWIEKQKKKKICVHFFLKYLSVDSKIDDFTTPPPGGVDVGQV